MKALYEQFLVDYLSDGNLSHYLKVFLNKKRLISIEHSNIDSFLKAFSEIDGPVFLYDDFKSRRVGFSNLEESHLINLSDLLMYDLRFREIEYRRQFFNKNWKDTFSVTLNVEVRNVKGALECSVAAGSEDGSHDSQDRLDEV